MILYGLAAATSGTLTTREQVIDSGTWQIVALVGEPERNPHLSATHIWDFMAGDGESEEEGL